MNTYTSFVVRCSKCHGILKYADARYGDQDPARLVHAISSECSGGDTYMEEVAEPWPLR